MEEISDHLWTGAFSIIMVISIVGNTLVLWTVLGKYFYASATKHLGIGMSVGLSVGRSVGRSVSTQLSKKFYVPRRSIFLLAGLCLLHTSLATDSEMKNLLFSFKHFFVFNFLFILHTNNS